MKVVVALGGNALLQTGRATGLGDPGPPRRRRRRGLGAHGTGARRSSSPMETVPRSDCWLSRARATLVVAPIPAGRSRRSDPGHGRVLAPPGPRERFPRSPSGVPGDSDPGGAPMIPAWATPTKFIGPVYSKDEAERLADERGWQIRCDGSGWRRVWPRRSRRPSWRSPWWSCCSRSGSSSMCAGGGGVPVVRDADGRLRGVEAVVDKDRTSAILAASVKADALLLLTDVAGVEDGVRHAAGPYCSAAATPAELRRLDLPAGSMGSEGRGHMRICRGDRSLCRHRRLGRCRGGIARRFWHQRRVRGCSHLVVLVREEEPRGPGVSCPVFPTRPVRRGFP